MNFPFAVGKHSFPNRFCSWRSCWVPSLLTSPSKSIQHDLHTLHPLFLIQVGAETDPCGGSGDYNITGSSSPEQ